MGLAEGISKISARALVSGDYESLHGNLIRLSAFGNIDHVRVTDASGMVKGHIAHFAEGPPELVFDFSRLEVPKQTDSMMRDAGDYLEIWYPVMADALLGWVVLEYNLDQLSLFETRFWHDNVIDGLVFALLAALVFILLFRSRFAALGKAAHFAINLDRRRGNTISLGPGALELNRLERALNSASHRLEKHERELKTSEARYRDFAESAADWVWESDQDHRIISLSDEYNAKTGMPAEEFFGKTRVEIITRTDPELAELHSADLAARKPFRDLQYVVQFSNGKVRHVKVSGKPTFAEDGSFEGYRGTARDVTEIAKAETEVQEAIAQMREAIESITDGFVLYDADDRLVICNTRYKNILTSHSDRFVPGAKFEDLLRYGVETGSFDIAASDPEAWIQERLRLHREPGNPIEQHLSDGRWLRISERRTQSGGIVGIRSDITDQKNADEALRQSEARFRIVAQMTSDWFWETDEEHRFSYISDAFFEHTGIKAETLVGTLRTELSNADGVEDEKWQAYLEDLRAHRPFRDVIFSRTVGGRVLNIRTSGSPRYDDSGNFLGYRGASSEISGQIRDQVALVASEQRLASIAESAADWYWETDENHRISYISANVVVHTGVKPEESIGKTRWEILGSEGEENENWRDHIAALDDHEAFRDFECEIEVDGVRRLLSTSGKPFFDDLGTFKGYRGAVREISAIKALEEQLASARRLESLGKLTGGVAHEFNNLLSIIGGYAAQATKHREKRETVDEALEIIIKAVEQGASLTKQMLSVGRRQTSVNQIIAQNDIVTDLAELLPPLLGDRITLHLDLLDNGPMVDADKAQISQALMNLCINARDAMVSRGDLTIKTFEHIAEEDMPLSNAKMLQGRYAAISVTDTGGGMDKDTVKKIFEPFFTTKEIGAGTGLGLAMVYGVMRDVNGYIDVQSKVQKGTTFTLYIPCRLGAGSIEAGAQLKALIVDEYEAMAEMVAMSLEDIGYQSDLAGEDGSMAQIESAEGGAYDLAVVSTTLVQIDGIELCQRLRAENPNLVVVYMSPSASEGLSDRRCVGDDANIIQKPFDPELLADLVMNIRND